MNNINKSVICIVLVIIFIAVFIGLRNSFAEKNKYSGDNSRWKYNLYFRFK